MEVERMEPFGRGKKGRGCIKGVRMLKQGPENCASPKRRGTEEPGTVA